VKFFTTEQEYEQLVRWASHREPHLSEAEIDWVESRARVLAGLLERWEPVGARLAGRSVTEQGELKLV